MRLERRGDIIDIDDDAKPVREIQRAGLLGNIAGGIPQSQKARVPLYHRFGQDRPRIVGQKSIDHHPVVTGRAVEMFGGGLAELVDVCCLADGRDHRLNLAERIVMARFGCVGFLEF